MATVATLVSVALLGFAGYRIVQQVDTHRAQRAYNAYVAALQPLLARQNALIAEMTRNVGAKADAELSKDVPQWQSEAGDLLNAIEEQRPAYVALSPLHVAMVDRARHIDRAIAHLRSYSVTQEKPYLEDYAVEIKHAGESLQAFESKRGIFARRHHLTINP
jgi:hypothetical protein